MKKVALIGLGRWGKNILRELVHLGSDVTVVLHSPNSEKEAWLKQEFPDVAHTYVIADVVGNESISHVCIATPMQTHFEVGGAFAVTPKIVFLEKPITDEAATAHELLSLFERGPGKLMVGHIFLYHDCLARVVEELKAESVRSVVVTKTSRTGESVRSSAAHFLDTFVHETSVLVSLFGTPLKLKSEGESLLFEFETFEARVNVETESVQKMRRFAFGTERRHIVWENETVYRDGGAVFSSTIPALERELGVFLNGFEKTERKIRTNNAIAVECVRLLEEARLNR